MENYSSAKEKFRRRISNMKLLRDVFLISVGIITAGFGLKWDMVTISIQFSGKKNGKMIHINNIFDKI